MQRDQWRWDGDGILLLVLAGCCDNGLASMWK